MDSPIGAPIQLPKHLLEGSNQRYLIKYNKHDDNLCFWRCLAYCIINQKKIEVLKTILSNNLMNIMKIKTR